MTLFELYKSISSSIEDDGFIDFEEFQSSLQFTNVTFASRIFSALDQNGDQGLEFYEFVKGFHILSHNATQEEKIKCEFIKKKKKKISNQLKKKKNSLLQNLWFKLFFFNKFFL